MDIESPGDSVAVVGKARYRIPWIQPGEGQWAVGNTGRIALEVTRLKSLACSDEPGCTQATVEGGEIGVLVHRRLRLSRNCNERSGERNCTQLTQS